MQCRTGYSVEGRCEPTNARSTANEKGKPPEPPSRTDPQFLPADLHLPPFPGHARAPGRSFLLSLLPPLLRCKCLFRSSSLWPPTWPGCRCPPSLFLPSLSPPPPTLPTQRIHATLFPKCRPPSHALLPPDLGRVHHGGIVAMHEYPSTRIHREGTKDILGQESPNQSASRGEHRASRPPIGSCSSYIAPYLGLPLVLSTRRGWVVAAAALSEPDCV